jgi:hypothetical protein
MAKDELRPLPGAVIRETKGHSKTVVVRVVEKTDKLIIHTRTIYSKKMKEENAKRGYDFKDHDGRITHAKMLCVNGPHAGQWHLPDDVVDYHQYNRSWGRGKVRPGEPPKCVLVHIP